MQKIYLLLAMLFFSTGIFAQVSVTATAGTPGPTVYTTLKLAFDAINAGTHQGVITVSITASTTETAAAVINRSGSGAASYTSVTVQPGADNITVSGPISAGAVIKLNAAANVTIDGDNPGSAGTNRNLTITNTSVTTPNIVWIGGTVATPATNDALRNCILINGVNTSSGLVVSDNTTIGSAGGFTNISIQNNSVQKSYIAIYGIATVAAGNGNGLNISNNDVNPIGVNANRLVGIYLQGIDGGTVANNNIGNIANTLDAANITGIWCATATINTTLSGNQITAISGTAGAPRGIAISSGVTNANMNVTGNTITNLTSSSTATTTGIFAFSSTSGVTIQRNVISNIKNTNGSGFGSNGIQLATTLTTANTMNVVNNFVSDVASLGFNGVGIADNGYGIVISTGGGYNLYYNTVVMNTNQTITTGLPAALNVLAGITTANTLNIRNNIFVNTQTVGTQRYCVLSSAAASVYGDINYNDYYFTGPSLGIIGGTNRATLAAWATGTGKDANSLSVQPVFVSATDFHLSTAAGANWCINGAGVAIAGVTNDIDGQTRSTGTAPVGPDLGADEITTTGDAAAAPSSQTICTGSAITAITYTGTGSTFSWTRDNTVAVTGIGASGTGSITGSLTNTTGAPVTVTFTITPLNAGGCPGPSFTATVLVNPATTGSASPASQSVCSGSAISTINLSGATTYSWTRDNTVAATGIAASGSGNISGTLTNTTAADVTVTFTIIPTANSCPGASFTATVLVKPTTVITPTVVEPTTCVSGNGTITLALSGAPGPYTFAWTGTGVVPASQNQTGLNPGVYTVVVTAGNLCTSTATITLNGPGGCGVCPTIPTLTPNPTTAVCIGAPVNYTASGLTSMGNTYGITFKYSATALADPYTGGTVISTVANGSLTAGGTQAAASNSFAAAGTYIVYAILSPTPLDPACRPAASVTVVVNPTPTVNAVTSQTACNGGSATAVTFSGAVAGTVFNWANNTPSIGLAASGTGNIASFTAVNTGSAPVTANIVVTPTYTSGGATCTGTTTNFNITVNPTATVNTVANQTVCNGGATTAVTFGSPTTGGTIVYNWTNNTPAIGLAASGTGNILAFNGTNATSAPLTATITVTPSYTNNAVTCTGTPRTFTITVNPVATVTAVANQAVCNNTSTTAVTFSSPTTGGTITYNWTNNTPSIGLAASGTGNIASFTALNATTSPVAATITVTPSYSNGVSCTGTASTFTITVNPTPAATISYAGSPYCSSAGTATVTRTGTAGGTYSSAAGLSINATTGDINLGASTAGTYTVTYTIAAAGGCAVFTTTASVTITAAPNATIAYTGSPYCIAGGTATVTRTGTAGGTYSSTAGLSLNTTTGDITLGTTTAGTYTVTYTVAAAGGCAAFSTTASVTVNSGSVAPTGATASNPSICGLSGTTNLTAVGGTPGTGATYKWYTGSCGGTLIGTGATLSNIFLAATTTYYVRIEGICGNTTCASVTVNVNPVPAVILVAASYPSINPSTPSVLNATISPAGSYVIQLYKNGTAVGGPLASTMIPLTTDSIGSYYVVVVNTVTGCSATSNTVNISAATADYAFVSPNPNTGRFTVKYYASPADYGTRMVAVYDGKGSMVFNRSVNVTAPYTTMDVDLNRPTAGAYFVRVTDSKGKTLASTQVFIMP